MRRPLLSVLALSVAALPRVSHAAEAGDGRLPVEVRVAHSTPAPAPLSVEASAWNASGPGR